MVYYFVLDDAEADANLSVLPDLVDFFFFFFLLRSLVPTSFERYFLRYSFWLIFVAIFWQAKGPKALEVGRNCAQLTARVVIYNSTSNIRTRTTTTIQLPMCQ